MTQGHNKPLTSHFGIVTNLAAGGNRASAYFPFRNNHWVANVSLDTPMSRKNHAKLPPHAPETEVPR